MKKKITALLLAATLVLSLTACGENPEENLNSQSSTENSQITVSEETTGSGAETDAPPNVNKHYYKTVHIYDSPLDLIHYFPSECDFSTIGSDENKHMPELTLTFNTQTGMVESASFSTYYFYQGEQSEFLQEDMATLSQQEGVCTRFSNFRTEIMGDVEKLTFDIDISNDCEIFEQYIDYYFIQRPQDIEGYKDAVYYSHLYNYTDSVPACEDRDGYFYDEITRRQVEWED